MTMAHYSAREGENPYITEISGNSYIKIPILQSDYTNW